MCLLTLEWSQGSGEMEMEAGGPNAIVTLNVVCLLVGLVPGGPWPEHRAIKQIMIVLNDTFWPWLGLAS